MNKLSKTQKQVLERMKAGDTLYKHRVGFGNPKRHYHKSGVDVSNATVNSLESKGLIEIDFEKTNEVILKGYHSMDYPYKIVDAGDY